MAGYEISTNHKGQDLRLYTPNAAEVRRYAEPLAQFYNDPHNSAMMDHSTEHTVEDIIQLYMDPTSDTLRFFIEADGIFLGDADLRHIDRARGTAEYAVMIGARAAQGKGWGTQVSLMVTHFAFTELGLQTVYLVVIPANVAGRRAYEKVGYTRDESWAAEEYKDQPDDIAMSIDRQTFLARHGEPLAAISIRPR
jgi:RimJ/RimL family protein N-acetyltransferase